jgi:hypothetical protein
VIEIHGSAECGFYTALSDDAGRLLARSESVATWQEAAELADAVQRGVAGVVITDRSTSG